MKRLMMMLAVLTACGDGTGGVGEGRVPEDYLPEGVTMADLGEITEAQELCYLHRQVSYARFAECDPLGPKDWGGRFYDALAVLSVSRQACHNDTVTMETYTSPDAEHVPRCLAIRAAAPCAALVVPQVDPAFAHCELATPTW